MSTELAAQYKLHRDAMYRTAAAVLSSVGRADEAEDAVMDAIVSMMDVDPQTVNNWEAFMVTAAKRKAIDRLRSAAVRHSGPQFDTAIHDREDVTDVVDDVADKLDRQALAAQAWDKLAVVTDGERRAIWQIIGLGLSRSEVAAEMGVSPSRISQLVTSGLGKLRREMDEVGDHNG